MKKVLWRALHVFTPIAVVVLGAHWYWLALVKGIGENCESHCVTADEVSTALTIFLLLLALWIVLLVVTLVRRRRSDPFG